jgi:hypothetical protein
MVVRLSRTNLLAQLVSRRMLAATRVAHSIYGSYGDATVRIEPEQAVQALARMEDDEHELDRLAQGLATLRLTYEQLAGGGRLEDLQRFLGVSPRPLRSWFTKLRTRPLTETVDNWDELAAALRHTPYARFLGEEAA